MPGAPDYVVQNKFALHMNNVCRGCYNDRLTITIKIRDKIREMGGLEELNPTRKVRQEYEAAHEFDKRSGRAGRIHGMLSDAGQILNGKYCKLVQLDTESKRWTVELIDGEKKALKEENLECSKEVDHEHGMAKVKLMMEKPQAAMSGGYQSSDKRPLGTKTTWAKVKGIHPGAVVRLKDLTGAAELNGRRGRCISFDNETGRWKIDLGDGHKNLKPDNLRPAPHEKPPTKQSAEAEIAEMGLNETRRAKLTEKERAAEDYGWEG